jgi:hypothetical protein
VTTSYLYRGVSRAIYETRGALFPKILHPFKAVMDDGNTVDVDPRSGVSTTPHQSRAEFYALGGGLHGRGVVVVLDRNKLQQYGIRAFALCASEAPSWATGDDEVILCGAHGSAIPRDLIVTSYDHGT